MSAEERRSPAASPAGTCGPRWRPRLEARWQAWVREVTELSLAYHVAAAASPDGTGGGVGQPDTQALLLRTVAARRKLADIEEALDRLAAGNFGSCEQCRSPNPDTLLAAVPEAGTVRAVAPSRPGPGPDRPQPAMTVPLWAWADLCVEETLRAVGSAGTRDETRGGLTRKNVPPFPLMTLGVLSACDLAGPGRAPFRADSCRPCNRQDR
jgi:DnaK suppressor protein